MRFLFSITFIVLFLMFSSWLSWRRKNVYFFIVPDQHEHQQQRCVQRNQTISQNSRGKILQTIFFSLLLFSRILIKFAEILFFSFRLSSLFAVHFVWMQGRIIKTDTKMLILIYFIRNVVVSFSMHYIDGNWVRR